MAIASSSYCPSFVSTVSYSLAQLGEPHLHLKDEQKCSIHAIYGGKDVFMFLPTGFGKSVCYQVLPFVFDHKLGLVAGSSIIVVSPLIALMVDQVRSLRQNGVGAVIISSGSGDTIVDKAFIATEGNLQSSSVIFSSPEALAHTKWREALENPLVSKRVCAIVVDEAHCVSKW